MNTLNWSRGLVTLLIGGAFTLFAQNPAGATSGGAPPSATDQKQAVQNPQNATKARPGGKHKGGGKTAADHAAANEEKSPWEAKSSDPDNDAAQKLGPKKMEWVKEEPYDPYDPPTINGGLNIATMIQIPPTEVLTDCQAGNKIIWALTPIYGKNTIYIKPKKGATETNLHAICKSGNVYTFFLTMDPSKPVVQVYRALPGNNEGSAVRTPGEVEVDEGTGTSNGQSALPGMRRGMEPEDVQKLLRQARDQERAKADAEKRDFAEKMLANRNDDYGVAHDRWCPFKIMNIFDVDGVTYIRFQSKDHSIPNFEVIGEDGKPGPVKWAVSPTDPNLIIVDQVFSRAVMTMDKKRAQIMNKGMAKANLKPATAELK